MKIKLLNEIISKVVNQISEDEFEDDYNDELGFAKKFIGGKDIKIEEYIYYSDYYTTLKNESKFLKSKCLFIGSGPLPLSIIILNRLGIQTDGLDYSQEAIRLGSGVLKKLGVNSKLYLGDATNFNMYNSYNSIILSLEAGTNIDIKKRIFDKIYSSVDDEITILVRSSNTSLFLNLENLIKDKFNIIDSIPIYSGLSKSIVIKKK